MTWSTVVAALDFNPSDWTSALGFTETALDSSTETEVLNALSGLYSTSPTAQAMLDDLASLGPIRFATVAGQSTGYYPGINGGDPFFIVNRAVDAGSYYISDHGKWIPADNLQLTLAHELAHDDYNAADPANDYGLTNPSFDFKGTPVRIQNTVAGELGLNDLKQASYHAALPGGDPMMSLLTPGHDYTDGNPIDISIFGTNTTDDNIDLSSRTDGARTLLFGFGGDDTLTATSGTGYLYGGDGNDSLVGGTGDDHLRGEAGDDTVQGCDGSDTIDGGQGTDSLVGGNGDDLLTDSQGGDWLDFSDPTPRNVLDGGAGNDTLVATSSGAILRGGPGDDVIDARGSENFDIVVQFGVGDGHDTILTNPYYATGDYGAFQYTTSGVGAIDFGSLSASDLEVKFSNWHIIHSYPTLDQVIGEVSIIIKSTGDSIDIGIADANLRNESGDFSTNQGDYIFDDDVWPMEFNGQFAYQPLSFIATHGGLIFG